MIEQVFYKKHKPGYQQVGGEKKIELPDVVDAEALMKVLNNPEMAALMANEIKG